MTLKLTGKTALITGGGTGIGKATALMLAARGMNIVVNYSNSVDSAESTKQEIEKLGVKAMAIRADVSKDAQVREMVGKIIDEFGRIDVVINNAGTTNFVYLEDLEGLEEDFWDRAFNVNVKGMFFVSRACSGQLKQNQGCIVNVTSIAGITGVGSSIAYSASKAAAISVTKSLAKALAPEVRVNNVAPGIVMTRWVDGKEDHIEQLGSSTPLGRVAQPEDVAAVIDSLVTNMDFVTGETIIIDGGRTVLGG